MQGINIDTATLIIYFAVRQKKKKKNSIYGAFQSFLELDTI